MNDTPQDYGISVDIGTSTITAHLINLTTGKIAEEITALNPQNRIGLDIITRIRYAVSDKKKREQLVRLLRASIVQIVTNLLRLASLPSSSVQMLVVVGNTVMHHFFFDFDLENLLVPPYCTGHLDEITTSSSQFAFPFECELYSPPLIYSFVGADAVAVMIAAGIFSKSNATTIADIGVNTEIVVYRNGKLWAASAPSGPAFEGMSLECGVPAIPGAIERIELDPQTNRIRTWTIENKPPIGLCGSGVISLLADLRKFRLLSDSGSLLPDSSSSWIEQKGNIKRFKIFPDTVPYSAKPIYLSQIDIRMVQQSKAAVCAAISMLLEEASLVPNAIERFIITGAFGTGLDLNAAKEIGLFPDFRREAIVLLKNGAIKGADAIVLNPDLKKIAKELAKKTQYIELMDNPLFEEKMALAQFLRPYI